MCKVHLVDLEVMNSTSLSSDITRGWVAESGGRGTLKILLNCIFTIFLCCWTSVCVNLPAQSESKCQRFLDKSKLACISILGPDFLLILAIGQYESAKESVKVRGSSDIAFGKSILTQYYIRISVLQDTTSGP